MPSGPPGPLLTFAIEVASNAELGNVAEQQSCAGRGAGNAGRPTGSVIRIKINRHRSAVRRIISRQGQGDGIEIQTTGGEELPAIVVASEAGPSAPAGVILAAVSKIMLVVALAACAASNTNTLNASTRANMEYAFCQLKSNMQLRCH